MKKCVLYTALSALFVTLLGLLLAYIGDPTIFVEVINTVTGLFPILWYVVIPPGVALLLFILNIVFKARRKDRNPLVPLAMFIAIGAYLVVLPSAYIELLSQLPPASLVYTTGALLVAVSFLVLLVITFGNTVCGKKTKKKVDPELAEEIYEVVEEEEEKPVESTEIAPVEFLDEEVEDEESLEVETPEEAASRQAKAKGKKTKEEKEYDRIYHIMKRAKDDRWIVKIAQSKKAIKIFDTQKEAIAYAEVLASNNHGVVRVFASKGANKGRIIM